MVYAVFVIVCLIGAFFYDSRNKRNGKRMFILLVLYLILLSGLSYYVGGDNYTYRSQFDMIVSNYTGFSYFFELMGFMLALNTYMPLWSLLNFLSNNLLGDFIGVQMFIAIIVNITIARFIWAYTPKPFTALLIYFFLFYFNFNFEVEREAVSLSIGLWAMEYHWKKEKAKFWILVILAFMFHYSAAILLLFPFTKFRVNIFTLIISFAVSTMLYFLGDYLASFIPGFFKGTFIGGEVSGYINKTVTIYGFLLHTIMRIFLPGFAFVVLTRKGNNYLHPFIKRLMPMYVSLAVIGCSFAGLSRFLNYYQFVYIVMIASLICYIVMRLPKNATVYFVSLLIVILCFIDKINTYNRDYPTIHRKRYELYVPYTSVFDQHIDVSFRNDIHQKSLNSETFSNFREKR